MTGGMVTIDRSCCCSPSGSVTESPSTPSASQEEFLTSLVRNLACSMSLHDGEIDIREGEELSSIKIGMSEEDGFSCFPSLSLENNMLFCHEASEEEEDRDSAERHAAALLGRPLLVVQGEHGGMNDEEDESHFLLPELQAVPVTMLTNGYASLTTLIKARLKAYAELLSLHALSVANADAASCATSVEGMESNLCEMLDRGASISLESLVSNFTILPSTTSSEESSLPLRMTLSVGLFVPTDSFGNNKLVHASLGTSGSITGVFPEDSLEGSSPPVVELKLDIEGLLSSMIQEASDIVAAVVQETGSIVATECPTFMESQNDQGTQGRVIPPIFPPKDGESRKRACFSPPRESVSVVSLSSCESNAPRTIRSSRVAKDATHQDDVCSTLSPEKCESILDSVLDDPFCHLQMPAPKKQRLSFPCLSTEAHTDIEL